MVVVVVVAVVVAEMVVAGGRTMQPNWMEQKITDIKINNTKRLDDRSNAVAGHHTTTTTTTKISSCMNEVGIYGYIRSIRQFAIRTIRA